MLLFFLASCSSIKKYSNEPDYNVDDWRNISRHNVRDVLLDLDDDHSPSSDSDTFLDMSKLLSAPPPPPIGNGELISFSITEEVPLKDVFIELARLADIDIQVDTEIDKGIILKVTDKPIDVVVAEICNLADLKYKYENGILKIERDLPYTVNYHLDVLIDHNFWSDIESSISYLLDVFPVKQQPSNNIGSASGQSYEQKISINKAASIISIYANSRAHRAISEYIEQAKMNYAAQVLIEAKVVEVSLNDSYKAGINWSLTESKTKKGTNGNESVISNLVNISSSASSASGLVNGTIDYTFGNKNLNVVIDAMKEFGDTKTLSSPRISSLNNQTATLDFVNTLVYFNVEKQEDGEGANGATKYTYTSTKQEEEIGVKLTITPTIDPKRNEVTLNVKPELSTLAGYVSDPVNEGNKVPEIQKRTLETSLKLKSGDIMVIGGLMSENISNSSNGVPFLMNLPFIGSLFRMKSNSKDLVETVIFIKATIIDRNNPIDKKDKRILNTFSNKNI